MKNYNFKIFQEGKDDQKRNKIKSLLDGQNLIMFFTKDNKLFGAPEESRIVFAKMMNPKGDEDMPDNWEDAANFMAFDLMNALAGQNTGNIFSAKDLPLIKVLDRDKMEKKLLQCPASPETNIVPKDLSNIGVINLKDKK